MPWPGPAGAVAPGPDECPVGVPYARLNRTLVGSGRATSPSLGLTAGDGGAPPARMTCQGQSISTHTLRSQYFHFSMITRILSCDAAGAVLGCIATSASDSS